MPLSAPKQILRRLLDAGFSYGEIVEYLCDPRINQNNLRQFFNRKNKITARANKKGVGYIISKSANNLENLINNKNKDTNNVDIFDLLKSKISTSANYITKIDNFNINTLFIIRKYLNENKRICIPIFFFKKNEATIYIAIIVGMKNIDLNIGIVEKIGNIIYLNGPSFKVDKHTFHENGKKITDRDIIEKIINLDYISKKRNLTKHMTNQIIGKEIFSFYYNSTNDDVFNIHFTAFDHSINLISGQCIGITDQGFLNNDDIFIKEITKLCVGPHDCEDSFIKIIREYMPMQTFSKIINSEVSTILLSQSIPYSR